MLENKTIIVVVPAYNEELLIGKVLAAVPEFVDRIIVVDDGSTDRTAAIAGSFNAVVVSHETNKGVGASLQTGISKALELGGDILVNIDADNQFSPADVEKLVRPIISGEADFATASRFKDKNLHPKMSRLKFLSNKFVSLIVSKIAQQKFYDVSCGFRAYSKDALLKLNLYGKFTYTHESMLLLAFQNTRIREISVQVLGTREMGKSKIASNVIKYGFKTLRIIFQTYRDYEPFKFFNFIGLFFLFIAVVTGVFTLGHYLTTGSFSPYKYVGFVSSGALIIYILLFLIGFVMESLSKIRRNQEKVLYFLKKIIYGEKEPKDRTP